MKPSHITLAKFLTYSGTLPLVFTCIAAVLHLKNINTTLLAATYGAVIMSFLCGIHWAVFLFFSEQCKRNLFIMSNMVALLAWMSLLTMKDSSVLLLDILSFAYLLIQDRLLFEAEVLPHWFYVLRRNATVIVVLSMAIQMVVA
jgi:hypothetical protein